MKIIVCLKQVPEEEDIRFDSKGNLIRENIKLATNIYDEYALENALLIKDKTQSEVITLTMGPPQSEELIKYSISKGADNGFIITDPNLKGSDAFITSKILSLGIKKIISDDDFIVFCGLKSSDGETSVVPSEIASNLQIPSLTSAKTVEINNNDSIIVKKENSSEKMEIEIKKPCVISFDISAILLRIISIKNRLKSKNFKPVIFSLKDFDIKNFDGLKESPTEVIDLKELKTEQTRNTKTLNINDENELSEIKKVIYE